MLSMGLVILMALALLLSFTQIAEWFGGVTNQDGGMIENIARTVLGATIGIFLITSGVAALAVPVVGVILIAVGLALITYVLWPWFNAGKGE